MRTSIRIFQALLSLVLIWTFSCTKDINQNEQLETDGTNLLVQLSQQRLHRLQSLESFTLDEPELDKPFSDKHQQLYQEVQSQIAEKNKLLTLKSGKSNEVHKIFPTGQFPDDVFNIRAIVDDIGVRGVNAKIILKSKNEDGVPTAFNFGQGSWGSGYAVNIFGPAFGQSGNIEFRGERNANEITTIHGGYQYPGPGTPNTVATSFRILDREDVSFRNIRFTDNAGINGSYSYTPTNVSIQKCIFEDSPTAILCWGTSGSLSIVGNDFLNIESGLWIFWDNPTCIVKNNQMINVGEGILLFKTTGDYTIKNNLVEVEDFSTYPFPIGSCLFLSNIEGGTVTVRNNILRTNNLYGHGITINDAAGPQTNPMVFNNNEIEMKSNEDGAGIVVEGVTGNTIENICFYENTIYGNGSSAFMVYNLGNLIPGFSLSDIHSLSFSENDISNFTSTCKFFEYFGIILTECPDVYFDNTSHDLVYCGEVGVIFDEGLNNVFTTDDCPDGCGDDDDDDDENNDDDD